MEVKENPKPQPHTICVGDGDGDGCGCIGCRLSDVVGLHSHSHSMSCTDLWVVVCVHLQFRDFVVVVVVHRYLDTPPVLAPDKIDSRVAPADFVLYYHVAKVGTDQAALQALRPRTNSSYLQDANLAYVDLLIPVYVHAKHAKVVLHTDTTKQMPLLRMEWRHSLFTCLDSGNVMLQAPRCWVLVLSSWMRCRLCGWLVLVCVLCVAC